MAYCLTLARERPHVWTGSPSMPAIHWRERGSSSKVATSVSFTCATILSRGMARCHARSLRGASRDVAAVNGDCRHAFATPDGEVGPGLADLRTAPLAQKPADLAYSHTGSTTDIDARCLSLLATYVKGCTDSGATCRCPNHTGLVPFVSWSKARVSMERPAAGRLARSDRRAHLAGPVLRRLPKPRAERRTTAWEGSPWRASPHPSAMAERQRGSQLCGGSSRP